MTDEKNQKSLSILYHIFSLGLFDAAYSLSVILGKVINVTQPSFKALSSLDLKKELLKYKSKDMIVGIDFNGKKNIEAADNTAFPGKMLFFVDGPQAQALAQMYTNSTDIDQQIVNSANSEVDNIICSGILDTLSEKLDIMLSPTLPQLYQDNFLKNIDDLIGLQKIDSISRKSAIVISTSFKDKNVETELSLFILFYSDTFEKFLITIENFRY